MTVYKVSTQVPERHRAGIAFHKGSQNVDLDAPKLAKCQADQYLSVEDATEAYDTAEVDALIGAVEALQTAYDAGTDLVDVDAEMTAASAAAAISKSAV